VILPASSEHSSAAKARFPLSDILVLTAQGVELGNEYITWRRRR
jgi:hypothetical protein